VYLTCFYLWEEGGAEGRLGACSRVSSRFIRVRVRVRVRVSVRIRVIVCVKVYIAWVSFIIHILT